MELKYELQKYKEVILNLIEKEKEFSVRFYVIDDEIESKIELALTLIFEKYNRPDLTGVIYTCIKELMVNATKANLKRILFEKENININDEEQYIKGMLTFREFLNEKTYINYFDDLKKNDYWVTVNFNYSIDGIKIEVINNAHITKIEDKRLREKLKKAMSYDDIAQFYMDLGDEIEGAGMGIALIVMLLKGLSIDPALFRIGNTKDMKTFARIEIPLTDNYISMRDPRRINK